MLNEVRYPLTYAHKKMFLQGIRIENMFCSKVVNLHLVLLCYFFGENNYLFILDSLQEEAKKGIFTLESF